MQVLGAVLRPVRAVEPPSKHPRVPSTLSCLLPPPGTVRDRGAARLQTSSVPGGRKSKEVMLREGHRDPFPTTPVLFVHGEEDPTALHRTDTLLRHLKPSPQAVLSCLLSKQGN